MGNIQTRLNRVHGPASARLTKSIATKRAAQVEDNRAYAEMREEHRVDIAKLRSYILRTLKKDCDSDMVMGLSVEMGVLDYSQKPEQIGPICWLKLFCSHETNIQSSISGDSLRSKEKLDSFLLVLASQAMNIKTGLKFMDSK
jgi:hypothetical protein